VSAVCDIMEFDTGFDDAPREIACIVERACIVKHGHVTTAEDSDAKHQAVSCT
jgi:hypothetical protein